MHLASVESNLTASVVSVANVSFERTNILSEQTEWNQFMN